MRGHAVSERGPSGSGDLRGEHSQAVGSTRASHGVPIGASGNRCEHVLEAAAASGRHRQDGSGVRSLQAGGRTSAPPSTWFGNPGLSEPTPVVVTKEGRVYGHLAAFGQCHVAYSDQCVQPPRSAANYAYFHTGTVATSDGKNVTTGVITLDTTHASPPLSPAATLSHYEDTGLGVADVHVGEDRYGIWIAGALRPGVTQEQVRRLQASPLSGDWRRIGGNLELVAALAVNVPGFPIPRPASLAAGGLVQSLVAAGVIHTARSRYTVLVPAPPAESPGGALARRVQASRLAMRVRHPVRSA